MENCEQLPRKQSFRDNFLIETSIESLSGISHCHVSSPEGVGNGDQQIGPAQSRGSEAREPGECEPARSFAGTTTNALFQKAELGIE